MKLPIPPIFGKKEASNHYLALLIRDEKASAVIFKEDSGKISVVGRNEEHFPTSVEHADTEEVLDTLDRTISRAEETLPPNVETEKTIFGLKETWVEEGKIKKEYLAKLKKVSDELKLSPVGFLVISEALTKLIEEEEGAPLSAIITEVGKNNVTLTLFKAGRNIESHSSHIEDSIPKTVDSLLKTFTSVEVLPSRIVIFDGENGEKIAQEFISHQWSRSLSFLHMPQVSVVPSGFDARAVVFGAALQMGFEVTGSIVDHTSGDIKTLSAEEPPIGITSSRRVKNIEVEEEIDEENKEKMPADGLPEDEDKDENDTDEKDEGSEEAGFPTSGDNFGFVMGKDVGLEGVKENKEEKEVDDIDDENKEESIHTTAHDFQFSTSHSARPNSSDVNISHEESSQANKSFQPFDSPSTSFENGSTKMDSSEKSTDRGKLAFLSIFSGILGIFSKLPKFGVLFAGVRGGSKLLLLPPLIIILLIGGVLFYIFKLEANVTLHVSPKTQEESQEVTLSATEENDFTESIIRAKAVSTTLDGEDSTSTTGKKETGEKAKGKITIYNDTDSKKTFAAGTAIESSNDLAFTLDKEVSVASRSGDVFSGTKSGTSTVDVTAKNIGNEYNLPSNTKFTIAGVASGDFAGKNDAAFSGGTKKEIKVVAKKDVEKLNESLPKKLLEQAKNDLKNEIESDETLLPEFSDITLAKKVFNKKEGEESNTLTLGASVTFEGLTYSSRDIKDYAKSLLKDKVSDDQALSDETLQFEVVDIGDVSEDEVKAKVRIEAGILPKLDTKDIVEELKGKSFADAEEYLSQLPQISKSDISLSPNIPFLPRILPRISKNIKIQLDTDE